MCMESTTPDRRGASWDNLLGHRADTHAAGEETNLIVEDDPPVLSSQELEGFQVPGGEPWPTMQHEQWPLLAAA